MNLQNIRLQPMQSNCVSLGFDTRRKQNPYNIQHTHTIYGVSSIIDVDNRRVEAENQHYVLSTGYVYLTHTKERVEKFALIMDDPMVQDQLYKTELDKYEVKTERL